MTPGPSAPLCHRLGIISLCAIPASQGERVVCPHPQTAPGNVGPHQGPIPSTSGAAAGAGHPAETPTPAGTGSVGPPRGEGVGEQSLFGELCGLRLCLSISPATRGGRS